MIRPKKKIIINILVGAMLVASAIVGAMVWQNRPPLYERVRTNCLRVMGRGECAIMHNKALLPDDVKQIFISGFGDLSADTYRNLQRSGVFMCDTIREACKDDERSEICRYGKAVY